MWEAEVRTGPPSFDPLWVKLKFNMKFNRIGYLRCKKLIPSYKCVVFGFIKMRLHKIINSGRN